MPGRMAIGPVARLSERSGRIPLVNLVKSRGLGPLIIWRDITGSVFRYQATAWTGALAFTLEVYMRATSGKIYARVYDITADVELTTSIVVLDAADGVSLTPTRRRSGFLALVDLHLYRVQFGVADGGAGAYVSAKIIVTT